MSDITITYDGAPLGADVPATKITVPQRAELGTQSNGGISPEDPAASLNLVGWRPISVDELDCSQPRLFTGYVFDRNVGRSFDQTQFVGPDARIHDTTITDLNAVFQLRIISGADGDRPSETMDARMAWILGSDYLAGSAGVLIEDTGHVLTGLTRPMDAADYRGSYPGDVLNDLANRSQDAFNWFAFWDPSPSSGSPRPALFFDYVGAAVMDCTLSISNVLGDLSSTCFAPITESRLERTPEAVYSDVIVEYKGGGQVVRNLATTEAAFIKRGTKISRPYTGQASTAESQGDDYLRAHSFEMDRITTTIHVPSASVGLLWAGQRMQVKFSHLPGYQASTWMMIVASSPRAVDDLALWYDVDLELVARPVGETFLIAFVAKRNSASTGSTLGPVGFDGSAPVAGYDWTWLGHASAEPGPTPYWSDLAYRKIGAGEPVGSAWVNLSSITYPVSWAVEISGNATAPTNVVTLNDQTLTAQGTPSGCVAAFDIVSPSVTADGPGYVLCCFTYNGGDGSGPSDAPYIFVPQTPGAIEIGQGKNPNSGSPRIWVGYLPVSSAGTYTITLRVETSGVDPHGGPPCPGGAYWDEQWWGCIGAYIEASSPLVVQTTFLSSSGDNIPWTWASVPGTPPPITGAIVPTVNQTITTTAPTVTNDAANGYAAGSTWLDTSAGMGYLLTDATTGAAVWVSTTAVSVFSFAISDGTTTVDPTTSLTFVGATLADLGGGAAEMTMTGVGDILDLPTAETDTTKVLAPDGIGGVAFRAEAGGRLASWGSRW